MMSTGPGPEEREPTEEELRAAFEEQVKQLRVEDVLLQTVVTLVNLAGRRLTMEEEKDPEQARLGIEAVRALLPLCPEEQAAQVKEALSQLQMLYAREAGGEAPAAQPPQEKPPQEKPPSRIWTPGQ